MLQARGITACMNAGTLKHIFLLQKVYASTEGLSLLLASNRTLTDDSNYFHNVGNR